MCSLFTSEGWVRRARQSIQQRPHLGGALLYTAVPPIYCWRRHPKIIHMLLLYSTHTEPKYICIHCHTIDAYIYVYIYTYYCCIYDDTYIQQYTCMIYYRGVMPSKCLMDLTRKTSASVCSAGVYEYCCTRGVEQFHHNTNTAEFNRGPPEKRRCYYCCILYEVRSNAKEDTISNEKEASTIHPQETKKTGTESL